MTNPFASKGAFKFQTVIDVRGDLSNFLANVSSSIKGWWYMIDCYVLANSKALEAPEGILLLSHLMGVPSYALGLVLVACGLVKDGVFNKKSISMSIIGDKWMSFISEYGLGDDVEFALYSFKGSNHYFLHIGKLVPVTENLVCQ